MVVDERQVAQVMTMLANNYNSPKGQGGDDGEISSALTSSLFSAGEGKVRVRVRERRVADRSSLSGGSGRKSEVSKQIHERR